jgi:hypothetical protein
LKDKNYVHLCDFGIAKNKNNKNSIETTAGTNQGTI